MVDDMMKYLTVIHLMIFLAYFLCASYLIYLFNKKNKSKLSNNDKKRLFISGWVVLFLIISQVVLERVVGVRFEWPF